MTDALVLDLVEKNLVTDQIVLTIGYDIENLADAKRKSAYTGEVTIDHYGRAVPKHAHGTQNIGKHTSSTKGILKAVDELFERIVNKTLLVRRINVTACHVIDAEAAKAQVQAEQLDIFSMLDAEDKAKAEAEEQAREKKIQHAVLDIKNKFGKNAIVKGMNLEEGATAMDRNKQIGGHKA